MVVVDSRLVTEAWCSGLTCSPVKAETAGSNPVASASSISRLTPSSISGAASLFVPRRIPLTNRSAALAHLGAPSVRRYLAPRRHRLTPADEAAILALSQTKSLRALAADFGVSHETIRAIVRGPRGRA